MKLHQFILFIFLTSVFACNSKTKPIKDVIFVPTGPDTVIAARDGGFHDINGIFEENGIVDYLIHKPFNAHGFISYTNPVYTHIKVSKEYQEQMHKYPSLDIFEKDETNAGALYLILMEECFGKTPKPAICDCTQLKIK